MAKKKMAPPTPAPQQENPRDLNHKRLDQTHPLPMDDSREKLQNLKSLNAMLLKETIERRQQVESLEKANKGLDAQLSRFVKEKVALETDLTRATEDATGLEIEKGVFCIFIEAQVSEMKERSDFVEVLEGEKREMERKVRLLESEVRRLMVEIEKERERVSQVCQERDLLSIDVKNMIQENDGLRVKANETERKQRESDEEILRLKKQCNLLAKEKEEKRREIEEVKRNRDLAEKKLAERVIEVEELKGNIEGVVREKDRNEIEKGGLKAKIGELEREVKEKSELVLSLRKKEVALGEKVSALEKRHLEAMEKEKTMAKNISGLVEEKKEKERTIERLMQEKDANQRSINSISVELKEKNGLVERLLRQNSEIEKVKAMKESEILEMHSEVLVLRDRVVAMQESIKDKEDKNTQLVSEVSLLRDACKQVSLERDNVQKDLNEERKNSMDWRSKVERMEKTVKETLEEYAKKKTECENLVKEKVEIANQVCLLEKEKALAQESLLNARKEIDDLSVKIESVGTDAERALTLLKNTAALLCQSNNGKDKMVVTENKLDGGSDPYATELEVIKIAFVNKETAVEDMKQQVEFLRKSVAEAKKSGGFWALVSSATTIIAAACLAYVARLR